MKDYYLESLKEKVVTIVHLSDQGVIANSLRIISYNDKFVECKCWNERFMFLNISNILQIIPCNEEEIKNFENAKNEKKEQSKVRNTMYG